jgi:hypothetical protein
VPRLEKRPGLFAKIHHCESVFSESLEWVCLEQYDRSVIVHSC